MDIYVVNRAAVRRSVVDKLRINGRLWPLLGTLALVALLFLPRVLGLDTFLTADEDDQIMFSSLFLKSVLEQDWAGALVLGYPGVPTLIFGGAGVGLRYLLHYAGWLPLPWASGDLMTTLAQTTTQFGVFKHPLDFLLWVRLPLALVAFLSVGGIYMMLRRLLDERLALLSTLIIAFNPFILAHSRIIHVDAPLAHFMFLSFLAFVLYLERGGWKWLIFSGLFGGLAVLSKTPAVLLGPILVVSGFFYALFPPPGTSRRMRWQRFGVALLGWGIIAVGAFFALWPAMWSRPMYAVDWLISTVESVNRMAHPTTGIFWAEQQSDQNPLYYLIAFPYHLTPLTTIGLVAGLGLIGAGLVAYWRQSGSWVAEKLPLALSLVVYVLFFMGTVSFISRRGDRYILPVYFAAGLLAALGLWWVAGWLGDRLGRFRITPARLLGAVVLVQVAFVLLYHPYYLAYYNPLLGGYRTAPYRVNIGWGEGLDLAARYLNRLTGPDKPPVAVWYSNQFAPFYHGPTIDLSDQSSALTGEYTVFYINQVQRGFPSAEVLTYFRQRQPLHVVKLGGIEYAWIYEGPVISQSPPDEYLFPGEALFGSGAYLRGLDVPQLRIPADAYAASPAAGQTAFAHYGENQGGLPVTLYWQTVSKIHGEHNIYIRLVDEQGHAWGQVDRLILAGLWRPDRWYPGYFIRDEYRLPIDPGTPPGDYHFEVGMYDFVTGQSYGVARNAGGITLAPPRQPPRLDMLDLPHRLNLPIDERLVMLGHTYGDATVPPGGEIRGKIFWQVNKHTGQDYRIEFSLLDPGNTVYVIAEKPLSPPYPVADWRRGGGGGVPLPGSGGGSRRAVSAGGLRGRCGERGAG